MGIGWFVTVGALLLAPISMAQPSNSPQASESKAAAPRFAGIAPCKQDVATEAPCQLATSPEPAPLLPKSNAPQGLAFAADGETLDILYRNNAAEFSFGEAPYLCCDLQTFPAPLSRGTWGARLHVPGLDKAAMQLGVANLVASEPYQSFVGTRPDHALIPQKTSAISATATMTIRSKALGSDRNLYVYRGELCKVDVSGCVVVYLADGSDVETYLGAAPPAAEGLLRTMVIVGLADPPTDDQFGGERIAELLSDAHNPAFGAFERFLTSEVIERIEGPRPSPRFRLVGGWSNGGAWARDMALRHPDLFSGAMAFSIGGLGVWTPPTNPSAPKPTFWLGAGTLEDKFFTGEKRQAEALSQLTFDVRRKYVVGGHSPSTWNALF